MNAALRIGTPVAEFEITSAFVTTLLADQHPDLAHLPPRMSGKGWDNAMFRLGDCLAVRLPRRAAAADLICQEQTGDRATDLASIWMLFAQPHVRKEVLAAYTEVPEATAQRAKAWAVLFAVMLLDTGLTDNSRNAALGKKILQRICP